MTVIVQRDGFVGNEDDFTVTVRIVSDTSNNSTDVNSSNNLVLVPFSVESESNINVAV